MAFDSAGNMYVGEERSDNSACIEVFTAEGQFLRKFGNAGSGKGELNFPSSISIDRDKVVYVTDYCNHCVSMFTTEAVTRSSVANNFEAILFLCVLTIIYNLAISEVLFLKRVLCH